MDEKTVARFWSKVDKSAGPDGCWLWVGKLRNNTGYGRFATYHGTKTKVHLAHRLAYRLTVGEPGDLFCCHRCDVRLCVNPAHLFLGTAKDNAEDMAAKGRGRGVGPIPGTAWNLALTEAQVFDVVTMLRAAPFTKGRATAIARTLGVSKMVILGIRRGLVWRSVTDGMPLPIGGPMVRVRDLAGHNLAHQ